MSVQYLARSLPVAEGGDPVERLASLFDLHYDRLYRLARRLVNHADDAQDLVQETFLKAARFPLSIPMGAKDEEAWLVRVLVNIRRDHWRKTLIRERHKKTTLETSRSCGRHDPEAALIAKRAVWQALEVLPPRRRAILVMHELEGLAIPAIASLLGVSAITVRWHLSIGKHELNRALNAHEGDTNENC